MSRKIWFGQFSLPETRRNAEQTIGMLSCLSTSKCLSRRGPLEVCVQQRIHERTGGKVRHLKVFVADGAVVIVGRTRNYYHKQLALVAALEILKSESVALTLKIDVD